MMINEALAPVSETPCANAGEKNIVKIPERALNNPALLYLYHRIEQILGIRPEIDGLIKLNEYLENNSGSTFIKDPASYEKLLTSRERIFEISNLVTVNETYFFREGVHFNLLENFLPELAKLDRPVQICSAATSTGCEAYSIAMLLDYHAKNGLEFDFSIDAFDVSSEAIKIAKNGRYTANTLRADGAAWKHILDSYLVQDGNEYVVAQDIRKNVRFFPHNIMRGLERKYDVIFFRNALIYFSNKNRVAIINDLADSLFHNGLLFSGVTETSSVDHPLLESRYLSEAFYFQKVSKVTYNAPSARAQVETTPLTQVSVQKEHTVQQKNTDAPALKPAKPKQQELAVDCGGVAAILETDEGQPNAKKILEAVNENKVLSNSETAGAELAAAAIYFLGQQDFNAADSVLSYLEKFNTEAFTLFLRGEYHFLQSEAEEARRYFESSAVKENAFWPAYYRIALLAAEGNPDRYAYKIKRACESLELGKDSRYECFLGGFSPDYYRRILENKLKERYENGVSR